VGGTSEIRVEVRVLAATNRDLRAMVGKGLFREDLFYRMSTITVEIPPLRKRTDDIELLARHFVAAVNARYGSQKRLTEGAVAALRRHSWPGNVRELLHAVEAAAVVCEGAAIEEGHLPMAVRTRMVTEEPGGPGGPTHMPTLEELELTHIQKALAASGGHRGNAARMLGISERNLYRKLKDYRLV
jgi:DNA-binding NtrC family response regulator